MWLASCFPDCLPPFSFFLCLLSFYCVVVFLYPFLCRFSFCLSFRCMFLYCFLPVSFFPLAFFLCLTPGCRTCRDPDVEHAETRMSNMPRPGCHTCQDPGVIQCPSVSPYFLSAFRCFLSRACAYIIMYSSFHLFLPCACIQEKYVLQHNCQSAFYKNV